MTKTLVGSNPSACRFIIFVYVILGSSQAASEASICFDSDGSFLSAFLDPLAWLSFFAFPIEQIYARVFTHIQWWVEAARVWQCVSDDARTQSGKQKNLKCVNGRVKYFYCKVAYLYSQEVPFSQKLPF